MPPRSGVGHIETNSENLAHVVPPGGANEGLYSKSLTTALQPSVRLARRPEVFGRLLPVADWSPRPRAIDPLRGMATGGYRAAKLRVCHHRCSS